MRWLLLIAGLCWLVAQEDVPADAVQGAPSTVPAEGELEITFLANEGFLLRTPDGNVLIDAFLRQAYAGYPALPEAPHAAMVAAEAPFDDVDLALVSHVHGDHFQPGSAAEFLRHSSGSRLITSPQVLADLIRLHPDVRSDRLEPVLPQAAEVLTREHEGIVVEFLRLPHSGSAAADIQNLGHRIVVDGWRILHLGDAEEDPEVFADYDLDEDTLDVVFVPYWYFLSRSGQKLVDRFLKARTQVAVHLPIEDAAELRKTLRESVPGLLVFETAMQRQVLRRDAH